VQLLLLTLHKYSWEMVLVLLVQTNDLSEELLCGLQIVDCTLGLVHLAHLETEGVTCTAVQYLR
jgi:hypothetical protein